MNNKRYRIALGTNVLLAISWVTAGGAQAASNAGFDAPAPLAASTNAIGSSPAASKPATGVSFEPGLPLSPVGQLPLTPVSQQNAVRAAKDYLDYTAFSHSGLINQLVVGDGYSTADATLAVDSITVDWNEQAAKAAQDYLDYTSFSHSGLINQLMVGDGYTAAQAAYGVAAVGL